MLGAIVLVGSALIVFFGGVLDLRFVSFLGIFG